MPVQRGLGKGLESLLNDADSISSREAETEIDMNDIQPDRTQPRQTFDEESLNELADSIRENGILQPILVRPVSETAYKIVAGERRFRAARKAGLKTIPCIVRNLTDKEASLFALVENLQREDLNPVEEALGYKRLMDENGYTQEEVAKKVGKSRPVIANSIRLLGLPEDALNLLKNGKITAGHAKAILSIDNDPAKMSAAAKQIVAGGLSVRDAEKLCRKQPAIVRKAASRRRTLSVPEIDKKIQEVQLSLKEALGVNVAVSYTNKDGPLRGTLSVDFYSYDQLEEFANKLGKK